MNDDLADLMELYQNCRDKIDQKLSFHEKNHDILDKKLIKNLEKFYDFKLKQNYNNENYDYIPVNHAAIAHQMRTEESKRAFKKAMEAALQGGLTREEIDQLWAECQVEDVMEC